MPTDRRPSIELDPIQLIDYADNFDIRIDDNVVVNTAYEPSAEEDDVPSGMDGLTDVQTTSENTDNRVILINKQQPIKYASNRISTGKYSVWSFIPCFLFEQFRRWANIFFLFIALMQQIPDVSPTGRYTTLVPLLFILSCSAIKEIIEDLKRHKADVETNHRMVEIIRNGNILKVKWLDVSVGDIIKVNNNNFFPADLLLLSSSEPQGMSFIETANLDGETNLKIRQGVPQTHSLLEPHMLQNFVGTLECEPPNRHLYEFTGTLRSKHAIPLGPDQILLRGAMLRNTSWIYGLVVYTGHETKLMKNSTSPPLKRSTVDKITNTQVLMLFAILLAMCISSCIFNEIWTNKNAETHWYISLKKDSVINILYNLLTFIILYNNLIPISLQVTLEMVRFLQAIFINMDIEMYHEETDTPAMARTSNLNEELGQIKYIFSDKTGTLTRNIMEFRKLAVGTEVYEVADSPLESQLIKDIQNPRHPNSGMLREMITLISVCHTVIPERMSDGNINYHAASPDERALINGAKRFGYVFETRTPEYITINVLGEMENYEVLNVIEFTSTRKRMSVIVRCPDNKIKLYCKGADTVIYERLAQEGRQYDVVLLEHLKTFATEGLRTLCCAMAVIDERKYSEWKLLYDRAASTVKNREELIEQEAEKIETNLHLLGATAIEDKLQEGVPDTIETLLKADIKIWVLTGDKQETAINIGYSCKLIEPHMSILVINEDSLDKTRDRINLLGNRTTNPAESPSSVDSVESDFALIIDGGSLKYSLTHDLQSDFIELCIRCKVVICCRVSPMQKAEVVDLVTKHTKSITLAVGDGANDVAMIQKAHVGVGISGVEGLQAACASDYSIAQFRFLKRLLLVHGAWNYSRLCKLILYSFYKNVCLYVIEFWYAIYSGFSGQIIFERWTIGLYNVIFTALPPLAMGLFDKTCSADTMITHPTLYKPSQDANAFNVKVFWVWIFNALAHSAILFWLSLYMSGEGIVWSFGFEGGYLVVGNFIYTYVVTVVCLKAGLVINSWTVFTHIAIWGSLLLWLIFLLIYSNIWPHINVGSVMLGMDVMVFTSPVFWLGLMLIPLLTIIPDVLILVLKNSLCKSPTEEIRELEIKHLDVRSALSERQNKHSLSETARLLKNVRSVFKRRSHHQDELVELSHGFAFSQEEGASVSQRDIIRAYDTTIPKPSGT